MPNPAVVVAAFDSIVGVASLITGIVGLAGPDPLESKIDGISDDLDKIDSKLDGLRDAIEGLGQDILAEFDKLTKRDISAARAKIETAYDELTDFLRKEKPTDADREKLSDLADAALNDMLAQFEEVNAKLPPEMAAVMVDAVNYAITMRLKVAMVAEDGAIGKDSIRDGLQDAAGALERIEDGFHAALGDNVSTVNVKTGSQEFLKSWTGYQLAANVSSAYAKILFNSYGNTKLNAVDIIKLAGTLPSWYMDASQVFRDMGTTWSAAAYKHEYYRVDATSDITGLTHSTTYTNSSVYPYVITGSSGLFKALQDASAGVVAKDKAALTELAETATLYRELGDGDDIVGTSGNDTRTGTEGNDLITGLAGNDVLSGGDDADVVRGGSGRDKLMGDKGNDLLDGGAGRDVARGGAGDDTLIGGGGNDRLAGNAGNDSIAGGGGNDVLRGQAGKDALGGDAGDDRLDGGKGNDLLLGGAGNDVLKGGAGRDRLEGGQGDDTLTGGPGPDTFVFAAKTGTDTITDFDETEDRLVFEGIRAADLSLTHAGGDTLLQYGTDTVVLDGVTLTRADLDMVFG